MLTANKTLLIIFGLSSFVQSDLHVSITDFDVFSLIQFRGAFRFFQCVKLAATSKPKDREKNFALELLQLLAYF